MAVEVGAVYATLGLDTQDFERKLPVATKQLETFTKQLDGKTRFAVQNLSFQINDIATSLASGGSPLRVLAQQGGQIVQVFQQGGGVRPVLAGFASTLRGLATPTTLAIGGLAALGAGFGVLLGRAASNTDQLREYDFLLKNFGTSSLSTARDVQVVTRQLRDMGVAGSDADASIKALLRNPRLNPGQLGAITRAGGGIAGLLGLKPEEGVQKFATAISSGTEAVVQLGLELNKLSADEAANILVLDRRGKSMEALNEAIGKIISRLPQYKDSISGTKDAVNELTAAWKNFLDSAADTEFFKRITKGLAHDFQELADVLGGKISIGETAAIKDIRSKLPSLPSGGTWTAQDERDREQTLIDAKRKDPDKRNSWINSNAPFPTLANQTGKPIEWTDRAASGFDPANPWATDLWGGGTNLWRSAGEIAGTSRGTLGITGTGESGSGPFVLPDTKKLAEAKASLEIFKKTQSDVTATTKLWNVEQQVAQARLAEYNSALAAGATEEQALERGQIAATETRKRFNIELGKENTLQDMRVTGLNKVADALKISEAAAIKETAAQEARVEALQRGGNVNEITARKLAEVAGRQRIDLQGAINDNQRNLDLVKLETSLQGEAADKISYQLDLLRAKQDLEKRGVDASSEIGENYLKAAEALAKQKLELTNVQRQMDELRDVADTLKGSFETIFDTIVDGTFKMRDALRTLSKDIGRLLLNKGFKALFEGESSGGVGTGLFGYLGKAFGITGGDSSGGGAGSGINDFGGGSDLPAFAGGGSFRVGGAGAIDSKLVQFRASPGEMVDVRKPGADRGGGGEVIRLELTHSDAFVGDIADQRIRTHSGTIVDVAVRRSQKAVQRNFNEYGAEAGARRA